MITFIEGIIDEVGENFVVIGTSSGIGYKVFLVAGSDLLSQMHENDEVKLYTSQYFRENDQGLIGFSTTRERSFYELLITVSGVGPRLASTLLAHVNPEQLGQMIVNDNVSDIIKVPGIGKKMAERLIIELRDKVFGKGWGVKSEGAKSANTQHDDFIGDLEFLHEALQKLGFSSREIKIMDEKAEKLFKEGMGVEDVMRILLGQN